MKRISILVITLSFVLLSGCNYPQSLAPTPFPTLVIPTFTSPPAVTALPTNPVENRPTDTPAIVIQPTPQNTVQPTEAQAVPTTQPGSTPSGGETCSSQASYVADVTIPDGARVNPGSSFVKTWRIRNEGTCAWGMGDASLTKLVFSGGDQMGAPNSVPLPQNVSPGSAVDISVNMVAPTTPGEYTGRWMLAFSDGVKVGFGPNKNQPITVVIDVPSPNPTLSATRVNFRAGATSASLSGNLNANQSVRYVVNAMQDQLLMLVLASNSSKTQMSVVGADGNIPTLLTNAPNTMVNAKLPDTQDYYITVKNGNEAANYSLNIVIPQRIEFTSGATSDTVDGHISSHTQNSYVLRALKGQTMTVNLTPHDGTLGLTIYGLSDGQPLVRAEGGATSFNGKLPATQDYILDIVPAVNSTDYTVKVVIK